MIEIRNKIIPPQGMKALTVWPLLFIRSKYMTGQETCGMRRFTGGSSAKWRAWEQCWPWCWHWPRLTWWLERMGVLVSECICAMTVRGSLFVRYAAT